MPDTEPQPKFDEIVDLLQRGAATAAETKVTECLESFPANAHAWFLLGVSRHMQRRHDDALQAFNQALVLAPNHLQALQAKATIFSETGRLKEMLEACEQAVALAPNNASTLANLGTALQKLDRFEDALHYLDRALIIDPSYINALLNKGIVLVKQQKLEEALAHNKTFVATRPEFPTAYYNLADTELLMHEYQQALETCDTGLSRTPRHAGLHMKRGIALACLNQFAQSEEALAQAQKLSPGILSELLPALEGTPVPDDIERFAEPAFLASSLFLAANLKAQDDCEWRHRDNFLRVLQDFIEKGLPHTGLLQDKRLAQPLLSMPLSPQARLTAMQNISLRVLESAHAHKLPPFIHTSRLSGRIRIGYVSPDFRSHSVSYLSKPLYRLHDRSRFEIHCYSLRDACEDPIQQEIRATCDHWHDISTLDAVAAAQRIHADGIDILVDLAGYTRDTNLELFALRPAPVQTHFLGYPGTPGTSFLDYVIADEVVCPETYQPYVAEKLMLLPDAYCPYDPDTPNAPTSLTRKDVGLPESAFVFCCFNASYKIDPTIFSAWLRLLQRMPGSVLWLVTQHTQVRNNLWREAERQGVHRGRLIFAPHASREHYLARLQLADLFLDTRWHNAHTIAADALWQGLPVLTCSGEHWSSRLGASLLQAVGMPELITDTLEEYEALALEIASNRERLTEIRKKLIASRSSAPLFSPEKTVRNLEQAYETMWRRWLEQSGAGG